MAQKKYIALILIGVLSCLRKTFRQLKATFLLFIALISFSNCTIKTKPEIPSPTVSDILDAKDITADTLTTDEVIPITWDIDSRDSVEVDITKSEIVSILNKRFNVMLNSDFSVDFLGDDGIEYNNAASLYQLHLIDTHGDLPDIFQPMYIDKTLIEAGIIREIPWDMIKQYMPKYTAMTELLSPAAKKYLFEQEERPYFLTGLETTDDVLKTFSYYRLDWLEEASIKPKGNLVELEENVYFTSEAFTFDEFTAIMRAFAGLNGEKDPSDEDYRWALGMDGGAADWYLHAAAIANMWGHRISNININGSAELWQGTEYFKSYLQYLIDLQQMDAIYSNAQHTKVKGEDRTLYLQNSGLIGWWSYNNTLYTINSDSLASFKADNPTAKLLITPPEIGLWGRQGVIGSGTEPNEIDTSGLCYVINAHVNDEKLARILTMYEAISFNPELFVLTHYGIEGKQYTWAGKPYHSGIIKLPTASVSDLTGLFISHVYDGNSGFRVFEFPWEELYSFASSDRARAMFTYPYKSDPEGIYASEENTLGEEYSYLKLHDLADEYMTAVLLGEKDLNTTWDEYIATLNENGLQQWNAYYDKLPYVND